MNSNEALTVVKSEYKRLLEEINTLKAVITALTSERDELKYHECRELLSEYNSKIGELEIQVLNAKLNVLRLKRMIEILQAQINRQEKVSEESAEEQVEQEYKEFEEDLNRKAEEARNSGKYKEEEKKKEEEWEREQEQEQEQGQEQEEIVDSEKRKKYKSRTDEMKALYRKIVKALHPDMNPDETEEEKRLFNEAVEAYNMGDLEKLREISALIDEGKISETPIDISEEDVEKLREIVDGLKLRVEELTKEIEEIKTTFPYTMKDFLHDDKAVKKKQKELNDLLYEYDKQAEELDRRLSEMIGA